MSACLYYYKALRMMEGRTYIPQWFRFALPNGTGTIPEAETTVTLSAMRNKVRDLKRFVTFVSGSLLHK